jgi:hypothetical protein
MDVHQRRRVALASVLTLAAIPAYLMLGREAAGSTEPALDASTVVTEQLGAESTVAFTVPPTTMAGPIFLDNTAVIVPPAVIDVVRPEPTADNQVEGRATFLRYDTTADERLCTAYVATNGAVLTVTNIANGLSLTCRNRYGEPLPAGVDLLIDTDLYTRIADLADAPIFVRFDW